MLSNKFFPYSSMQEINLDWILTKIKNILRFVPDDGAVGQILRRTAHGAEWSDEQGGGGAVSSVNGQTGAVVLTASDVGALPDTYVAPVDSVNGQTGTVVLSIPSDTSDLTNTAGFVDAAGAAAAAPVQSVNSQTGAVVLGKSDVGLGSVDNVQQYSASNPPPYPVTSVNGQTGAVTIPTALPSVVVDDTSTTGNNYTVDKTYTVTGSGIIIVYASCASDQNDSGWDAAYVLHNGTRIMAAGGRYTTTSTVTGAFASVPIAVSNGDTIQVSLSNTKVGDRTFYRRFLCFGGCTLS